MKIAITVLLAVVFAALLFTVPAQAQGVFEVCPEGVRSASMICGDDSEAEGLVKQIINTLLYAIGILAIIMIIHSGLKYVSSRGDAEMIKSAKNTLMYAVIGLIVSLSAFVIVNFVISRFGGTNTNEAPPNTNQPAAQGGNS